jgi:hypothetical protein
LISDMSTASPPALATTRIVAPPATTSMPSMRSSADAAPGATFSRNAASCAPAVSAPYVAAQET